MRREFRNKYLVELIRDKELTFEQFFNLSEPPVETNPISHLTWELDNKVNTAKEKAKDVIENCKNDCLHLAKDDADDLISHLYGGSSMLEKIEDLEHQYIDSYNDMRDMLIKILENEKIDISKYSIHLTDKEIKTLERKYKIERLLNNSEKKS